MKRAIFAMALVFLFTAPTAQASSCAVAFSSAKQANSADHVTQATQKMISYLETLLERQTLGDAELQRLEAGLKAGQVVNPFGEIQGQVEAASLIHREGFERIAQEGEVNQAVLLQFVRERLSRREAVKTRREHTKNETTATYRKMTFHRLSGGEFRWKGGNGKVHVETIAPFELTDTPVTQAQWVEVMGKNPASNQKSDTPEFVTVNGKLIQMLPDHPIENVSAFSVFVFANRLSELHGLDPVYDLSQLKAYTRTRAEDGDLQFYKGTLRLFPKTSNSGYRLPSHFEHGLILRAAKNLQTDQNAKNTQAVGDCGSVAIDGNVFYDVLGNVIEISVNSRKSLAWDPGGRESFVSQNGSFLKESKRRPWSHDAVWWAGTPNFMMGFRLARDVAPGKDSQ